MCSCNLYDTTVTIMMRSIKTLKSIGIPNNVINNISALTKNYLIKQYLNLFRRERPQLATKTYYKNQPT